MNIGLIDVDGHNFPNLALMRISAFYKSCGYNVEWWRADSHYDVVYMSKVFSDTYSKDLPTPKNADTVIRGGTGYAIKTVDGIEKYDKLFDPNLTPEIEKMFPDYSIYPQYDYAVSMTSRGCPRGCAFCHVAAKEGRCAKKVADVKDFWNADTGKTEIKVLDPNITACKDKEDLLQQYVDTGCYIDFTQGLDIRLISARDIELVNRMKIKQIHFAWDNPKDKLDDKFYQYSAKAKHKPHGSFGMVYCLTNFNSTLDEDLRRIYTLRDLGFDPYVMIYNKNASDKLHRDLQRWCNNKIIFRSCRTFEEYQKDNIDRAQISFWEENDERQN